jgi:RNA recognition motif-containing protein
MGTRLYVGNLSHDATAEDLRACFAECGGVADVEIATDRFSDEPRGFAFVTMTTDEFAATAIAKLHGAMFQGRPLRVNEAPKRATREAAEKPKVKIAQQFRERHNMAYELDCSGTPITLRIFPTENADDYRIEARASEAPEAAVITASAKTPRDALAAVGAEWSAKGDALGLPSVDWEAITTAMVGVRAL